MLSLKHIDDLLEYLLLLFNLESGVALLHLPQPFTSSDDMRSGNRDRALGTAALKLCPDMVSRWKSHMSANRVLRAELKPAGERSFPDG